MGVNCARFRAVASCSGVDAAMALQQRSLVHERIIIRFPIRSCSVSIATGDLVGCMQHVCAQTASGTLQCVEFVTAAFFLQHAPAYKWQRSDFWQLYQHRPGWLAIPASEYPIQMRGSPDRTLWCGREEPMGMWRIIAVYAYGGIEMPPLLSHRRMRLVTAGWQSRPVLLATGIPCRCILICRYQPGLAMPSSAICAMVGPAACDANINVATCAAYRESIRVLLRIT